MSETSTKPVHSAEGSVTQALMGAWVLQAKKLRECPLHRVGDRLVIRPPALHHAGQSCCLIPFLRLRTALRDGQIGDIKCSWTGCRGTWTTLKEEPDSEAWDPGILEDDLENKPFLLQLPQAIALQLLNAGIRQDYSAGTMVLQAGQTNQELYLVIRGTLEVLEGQVQVATIRRGECVGELSVLTRQPATNAVRAMVDCTLVTVQRDRFYELLSKYGALGTLLNRLLARRLRASNQQLEQILRPGIWGNLEIFPFLSVVQSIQAGTMTGMLSITRSRGKALFGFDKGQLRFGQVDDVLGEDALLEIFRWSTGIFRFQNETAEIPVNIDGDTMTVLLDNLRRFDEIQASESGATTRLEAPTDAVSQAETRWERTSSASDDTLSDSNGGSQTEPLSTGEFEVPLR